MMQKINANSNEDIVSKLVVPLEQRGKKKLFQNFPLKFDIPWGFFFCVVFSIERSIKIITYICCIFDPWHT